MRRKYHFKSLGSKRVVLVVLLTLLAVHFTIDKQNHAIEAPTPSVLVLHENFPMMTWGSDTRLLRIIRLMRIRGWNVTYLARHDYGDTEGREALMALLSNKSIQAHSPISKNSKRFFKNHQFDIVFSPIWFWPSTPALRAFYDDIERMQTKKPLIVALHDDAHLVRAKLLMEAESQLSEKARWEGLLLTMQPDLEFLFKVADINCFITDQDQQMTLASGVSLANSCLLRAAPEVQKPSKKCVNVPFEERRGFVFVGNGENPTNYLSMEWFFNKVWSVIKELDPTVIITVIGASPNMQCQSTGVHCGWTDHSPYHGKEEENGIFIAGVVEDLETELCRSRVILTPISTGTGVNTKSFLSFMYGIPLVSTIKGAVGILARDTIDIVIADDPLDYAEKAVKVHNDPKLWETLHHNSMKHLEVLTSLNFEEEDFNELAAMIESTLKSLSAD